MSNRSMWPSVALSVGLVLAALSGQSAWAQATYRCTGDSGRVYWSDKPCNPGKLQQFGPVPQPRTPSNRGSSYRAVEAPPHHEYLSGECRTLSDGLRLAHSNRSSHDTLRGLVKEWHARCGDDEEQARRRHQEQAVGERTKKDDERRSQDEAKAQQQNMQDQCGELKRILRNKRERTNLTPGERGDLARFEENYKNRCGG